MGLDKFYLVCMIVTAFSCHLASETVLCIEQSGENIDNPSDFEIAANAEPGAMQFQDSPPEALQVDECDCGDYGTCSFDQNNNTVCNCSDGYLENSGKCRWCDCGEYGTCSFDASDKTICNCSDGFKEIHGTCQQCDCGKRGICILDKDNQKVCKCDKDYAEYFGTCEWCWCGGPGYASSCTFDYGKKEKCVCSEGYEPYRNRCSPCKCTGNVTSSGCIIEDYEWSVTCPCADGYAQGYYRECKECDCGEKGKCSFVASSGPKKCDCVPGYADDNGTCKVCDCGRLARRCFFENGTKTCDCDRTSKPFNDYCKDCSCGPTNTYECVLNSTGKKNCTCSYGYSMKNDACASCSPCKQYPLNCTFDDDGSRQCVCKDGFASETGVCTDCECGEESTGCYFNSDGKHCKCKTGYEDVKGQCKDTDECLKSDSCPPEADCINTIGSYYCVCRKGYSGRQDSEKYICEDIDECGKPEDGPCYSSGAACFNTVGSYRCDCIDGYKAADTNSLSNAPMLTKCVIAGRPFRTSSIVFGVFFGVLFVAIGIYVFIMNKRNRNVMELRNEVGMR